VIRNPNRKNKKINWKCISKAYFIS